jgi:hypothetical protein
MMGRVLRYPDAGFNGRGLKLARAVRGRWPPIKIVTTCGHVGVPVRELPEGGRFPAKPYSSMQIAGVLRELTGA